MSSRPEIDGVHARQLLGPLLEAFRRGDYPYHGYSLPQDLIPEEIRKNPLDCAAVLFTSCYLMRGTIRSDYAMKRIVKSRLRRPDIFDFKKAMRLSVEDVQRELKWAVPYKSAEIARFLVENARRMCEFWDANPLNIFKEVHTPEDLYRFIANKETTKGVKGTDDPRSIGFLGFQKKMSSMLAYFYVSCGLIDAKTVSPPVDFHHVRIFLSTKMLKVPSSWKRGRYEVLQPFVISFWEEYMRETGATMRELGDIAWIISNTLCSRAPSNQTKDGSIVVVDWSKDSAKRNYGLTCGACPLERHCVQAVQANAYYQKGYFELNQHRQRPELTEPLPFAELPHYRPKSKVNGHSKGTPQKQRLPLLFAKLPKTEKRKRSDL